MQTGLLTKNLNVPSWYSYSSEALNVQSRRVSSLPEIGSLVNQLVTSKTNAKTAVKVPESRTCLTDANFFLDANNIGMNNASMDINPNSQLGAQTVKGEEQGISHFYRKTTNL